MTNVSEDTQNDNEDATNFSEDDTGWDDMELIDNADDQITMKRMDSINILSENKRKRSLGASDDKIGEQPTKKRKLNRNNDSLTFVSENASFWGDFKDRNSSFIGSELSAESVQQLNRFHQQTNTRLMTEQQTKHIPCCCIPITLYSNIETIDQISADMEKFGIDYCAKKQYNNAFERGCNVAIPSGVMDILWNCLGNISGLPFKGKKFRMDSYECAHCRQYHFVPEEITEKGKKTPNNSKYCPLCDKDVPDTEINLKEHIEGKEHKKRVLSRGIQKYTQW